MAVIRYSWSFRLAMLYLRARANSHASRGMLFSRPVKMLFPGESVEQIMQR